MFLKLNPQNSDFQHFAKLCDEMLPGHEPSADIMLARRMDEAKKSLPSAEFNQLNAIVTEVLSAIKNGADIPRYDAMAKLNLFMIRVPAADYQAVADVHDQIIEMTRR